MTITLIYTSSIKPQKLSNWCKARKGQGREEVNAQDPWLAERHECARLALSEQPKRLTGSTITISYPHISLLARQRSNIPTTTKKGNIVKAPNKSTAWWWPQTTGLALWHQEKPRCARLPVPHSRAFPSARGEDRMLPTSSSIPAPAQPFPRSS